MLQKAGKDISKFQKTIDAIKEVDIDDEDANGLLDSLLTETEAENNAEIIKKVSGKAKAEVLNGIDSELKKYESKLNSDQKTELAKFGKDTNKRYNYVLKALSEKGSSGQELADKLEGKVEEMINAKIESGDLVPKDQAEKLKNERLDALRKATHTDIISIAKSNEKLNKEKADRHFSKNFVSDVEALLSSGIGKKKVKAQIDFETGKIVNADNTELEVIGDDGKPITIDGIVASTIETYDWAAKSPNPPGTGIIKIPGGTGEKIDIISNANAGLAAFGK
ncbi:hypothetical protein [Pseudarcicella hirudinis]|nr:hypothetical protein [Pseudarcicella hirudinis]